MDLTGDSVVSFEHIPGVQPNFTLDEFYEIDAAMREHPDVIAALAERGFTDMDLILIDTWTYAKALMPEKLPRPPAGLVRPVGAGDAGGQSLRASGLGAEVGGGHEHPRTAGDRAATTTIGHPEVDCEYVPSVRGVQRRAPTSSRCTSPSPKARRSVWTARN